MAEEYIKNRVAGNAELAERREEIERQVIAGAVTPTVAAKAVIDEMEGLLFK